MKPRIVPLILRGPHPIRWLSHYRNAQPIFGPQLQLLDSDIQDPTYLIETARATVFLQNSCWLIRANPSPRSSFLHLGFDRQSLPVRAWHLWG
jgi:hypothetical protein